jgi:molybdopterin-guanine dinucleotide biosynthesis protein A
VARLLALRAGCAEALIVSADSAYDRFGARRVSDVEPGRGAPGGVVTALLEAATPWVLVVACDMAGVTEAAVAPLRAEADAEVRCYQLGGRLEPLLAIYAASLGPRWRPRLADDPSLQELVRQARHLALEPASPRFLESVNTPDDLERAGARVPRVR